MKASGFQHLSPFGSVPDSMSEPWGAAYLEERARSVRALVLDVDGVLTDGRLYYLADGSEVKVMHARDGLGLQLLRAAGLGVALISGRASPIIERRAAELGIEVVLQGIRDKVAAYEQVLAQMRLNDQLVAYVGDDLPDLPILSRAGLSFAPADAAPEVRGSVAVVLRSNGGQGAVREVCERLLKARGAWAV